MSLGGVNHKGDSRKALKPEIDASFDDEVAGDSYVAFHTYVAFTIVSCRD